MNPYNVEVLAEGSQTTEYSFLLTEAVNCTLNHHSVPEATQVTVLLVDDNRIRQLNKAFLGYDEPTDVLSFPVGKGMPGVEAYLGDIAISVPKAMRQAEAGGHSIAIELQLLVVHGTLHLLGYDHGTIEEKAEMWQTQGEILEALGSKSPSSGTIS